ncbi:LysR family transcriptional regulator [Altericroceibacterium spongiae]|uniref:LysR family transcriptional regulator n=1 Tax=Altericroceibacterium spongiae TaxID=2320269 RepID=A0A420EAD5_9SPHN|nr:LysR family transcriptional regulator [Altericroceibacterium spongiae]RKF17612.1 LysR family transcriptional regulator [Altericroceibacterium spongiae]
MKLAEIDLNLLYVLSLLLQTRSVTGTARKLGVSQPAVSRSLAQLRNIFQDPLLLRTNHGMELTQRAEELLSPLQDWRLQTSSLLDRHDFEPRLLDRTFRIASTDYGMMAILAPVMEAFHHQAPMAGLEIVPFSDTMVSRLGAGDLDLIVIGGRPRFAATYEKHLFTDECVCMMRSDHPLLGEAPDRLTLDQFLAWPHVSILIGDSNDDPVNSFVGSRAAERRICVTTPYFHGAVHFLPGSDAILTLPKRLALTLAGDDRIVMRKAPASFPDFDYWVLWHERNRRDAAAMWIVDLLAEAGQSLST